MKNKLLRNLALSAAFIGAIGATGCSRVYSDGDRVGTVSKISYKGIFNKSWEGQLAMDNFVSKKVGKHGHVMTNTFEFSVDDPAVIKQLQDAQASGERVDLHYSQVMLQNPFVHNSSYMITGVKSAVKPAVKAPQQ
jgi:hypothetical protein